MQIQKIDINQNKSQQSFGLRINTERLLKLEEYGGIGEKTPERVLAAIQDCESAIAKIKPLNETVHFYRSSHTTGNNHLNAVFGMIHTTVTNDIFDSSKDLGKDIMRTVKDLAKTVRAERRAHQRASRQKVYKIPFIRTVKLPQKPQG